MLKSRKAFTTIEILLVVGVLVILIGMVVWGLKGAGGSASTNSTRTTLQNLTNMSEELNRKSKLVGFEGPPADMPIYPILPPPAFGGETAPGDVTDVSKNNERRGAAVIRTAEVMRRLQSIPDNKKVIEKLPSDQILAVPTSPTSSGTVVLDGWRNPILFVPTAGLKFVASSQKSSTYSPGTNYSKGARVIAAAQNSPTSNLLVFWTAMTNTSSGPPGPEWFEGIRSPDGRSFWASAGPDGNFTTGDDNIYSFEQ
jgi:type II secretory pathway pseudopilin PulG